MDHVETRLVAAIANGDHDSRIVYMDLLEQREDHERLEYLRLDEELHDLPLYHPRYTNLHARHRELEELFPAWCEQIGRAYVRARIVEQQLRVAITAEDPIAFEDLQRLASRFSAPPIPTSSSFMLPDQLQYLETVHALANRRR